MSFEDVPYSKLIGKLISLPNAPACSDQELASLSLTRPLAVSRVSAKDEVPSVERHGLLLVERVPVEDGAP